MFLERFFEPKLAQTSYLVGCPATGQAIVIDPNRDVEPYVQAAQAKHARITHITETHIHADFVSGSRELAARTGAKIYLSKEGGASWQYTFGGETGVELVGHGAELHVGRVRIHVLHTPGHTPEHLTFLVTDEEGATEPIGAMTGDFLFVGDVGRPDLLERAAKQAGTMDASARALYRSLKTFSSRPDWLQIWPGHGAGSSCGKGISAIPQSTLGYEKRFNWAFRPASEDAFVSEVLAGQPDPPKYFAEMKKINREGPRVLGGFPHPPRRSPEALEPLIRHGAVVIDTRRAAEYAVGHIPGTINIPLNASFTTWAGWLIPYTHEFFVIVDDRPNSIDAVVRDLSLIGLDRLSGHFDAAAIDWWASAGHRLGTIAQIESTDLAESLKHGGVTVIDVRSDSEWDEGHIAGARHVALGHLAERASEIPRSKPVVLQCQGGGRSSIAASVLRSRGFDQVINLSGGLSGWIREGLPTETSNSKLETKN